MTEKVWIVSGRLDHDHSDIEAVFSSKKDAEEFASRCQPEPLGAQYYEVEEFVIDELTAWVRDGLARDHGQELGDD